STAPCARSWATPSASGWRRWTRYRSPRPGSSTWWSTGSPLVLRDAVSSAGEDALRGEDLAVEALVAPHHQPQVEQHLHSSPPCRPEPPLPLAVPGSGPQR